MGPKDGLLGAGSLGAESPVMRTERRLIVPRYMTALSNEEAFAELWYSRKAIKDLLGVTTQCW